jgi:hypothetical protein
MLGAVVFVKTLARIVLVLSVSGAVPQPFAHADSGDAGGLRASQPPVALTFVRALRPTEGPVLGQDGVRFKIAARSNHVHPGLSTTTVAVPPPGLIGALVQRPVASKRFASSDSAPLRGPPDTI